jgi:hypothetical protein
VTSSFPSAAANAGWPFSDLWRASERSGRVPSLENCHVIGNAFLTMLLAWNQARGRATRAIAAEVPSRFFETAKDRVVLLASPYWKHHVTGHSKWFPLATSVAGEFAPEGETFAINE